MKAKFKYIRNYKEGGKVAEMFIYDEIDEGKVDGVQFAYEMRYLIDYENTSLIKVRINSPGGNVMHAFSIVSAIINANNSSKTQVDTYNDGVAASSAGFILLCGKNVYAKDYSRLMIHGVSSDMEKENENDRAALLNFKEMITQVFVSRTGIVASYIDDLMTNGRDNWFNIKDAIKNGFLKGENIENTGIDLGLPEELTRTALAVANKAKQILNEVKPKKLAMKKVIAKLGLQDAASEDQTFTAVSNVMKERDEAKTALTAAQNVSAQLETANAELKTKLEAQNKGAALTAVNNAISAGKFTPKDEEAKTALIGQAENNLEGFNAMVSMMPTKASNVLDQLTPGDDADALAKVNNRGLRQLEKEDIRLVAEIRNNHRAEYIKLYNAAYNTNKTEKELY